jgi:hypothetical protein
MAALVEAITAFLVDGKLDAIGLVSLCGALGFSKWNFSMRGLTYRKTVVPLWQEQIWKSVLYFGLLATVDAGLRRGGQLLSALGVKVFPSSAKFALLLRVLMLHGPFAIWAITGPLSAAGTSRDDRGFSSTATKARLWFWISKLFGHTRILLSEEWADLSSEQREKWADGRHYLIPAHPHGLLPIGAIVNGLTWAGGGMQNITTSGKELPGPSNPGPGLHQKWFPHMRLRCTVASGAAGLFPGFYEMFKKLGGFECTKPFVVDVLRNGRDVAVFPGGAAESSYATPGRYVCLCKERKGFVRLAIEERRDLMPMWCFGDEAIMPQMKYENVPQLFKSLQRLLKEMTGLTVPPALNGLPNLVPLTLVIGVPVGLEDLWPASAGGAVSDASVEEGHKRYMQAQQALFDRNKALVPGGHANAVIEFL